jgi:hypothetical protein
MADRQSDELFALPSNLATLPVSSLVVDPERFIDVAREPIDGPGRRERSESLLGSFGYKPVVHGHDFVVESAIPGRPRRLGSNHNCLPQ